MKSIGEILQNFWDHLTGRPVISWMGAAIGVMFPIGVISLASLGLLIAIDTATGRYAAYARDEAVYSWLTFRKMMIKLQGYMIFVITAALTTMVTREMSSDSTVVLRGALGLLSAVEFFSITENLYDMKWIQFDPRKVPLFKSIVDSIRPKKASTDFEKKR